MFYIIDILQMCNSHKHKSDFHLHGGLFTLLWHHNIAEYWP